MPEARVHRIPSSAPDDMSGLMAAIGGGHIDPASIVAILGKTEGNGCVNDFTRAFAVTSLQVTLARYLPDDAVAKIAMVMSGGTEGALSPHLLIFEARAGDTLGESPALALGTAITKDIDPAAIGTLAQVDMVAEGVAQAMDAAGISSVRDVHFVQIKCPLLTADRIGIALARGRTTVTNDTLKSMGFSRGASALGVALALGEHNRASLSECRITQDTQIWSARASTSAGVELLGHEILVLGMSAAWSGPLIIDHAVMKDGIDIEPVRSALARLSTRAAGQLTPAEQARVIAVLAKAEPGSSGMLRGLRHTMLDDSDISATRHARAFTGGALSALIGRTDLFVSGGAEHQGPDGGGPVAIIASRMEERP